jgi:hypothetical protein
MKPRPTAIMRYTGATRLRRSRPRITAISTPATEKITHRSRLFVSRMSAKTEPTPPASAVVPAGAWSWAACRRSSPARSSAAVDYGLVFSSRLIWAVVPSELIVAGLPSGPGIRFPTPGTQPWLLAALGSTPLFASGLLTSAPADRKRWSGGSRLPRWPCLFLAQHLNPRVGTPSVTSEGLAAAYHPLSFRRSEEPQFRAFGDGQVFAV